jgi:hypothetical protein
MFGGKLPGAVKDGQTAYEKCYGSDKSGWKFNTQCCAYNRQATDCKGTPPIVV